MGGLSVFSRKVHLVSHRLAAALKNWAGVRAAVGNRAGPNCVNYSCGDWSTYLT